MKLTRPAQPWQGRIDALEGPRAIRWHQRVLIDSQPAGAQSTDCSASGDFSDLSHLPQAISLIGFCCDAGVARNQGRVGASGGPAQARKALANIAWHAGDREVMDLGDVLCDGDALEDAQAVLADNVRAQLTQRRLPLTIGGGHEVAWGSWSGLASFLQETWESAIAPVVGILNLDAHFDLRADLRASSGTPFRQIAEDCDARGWPFRYACLGVARTSNTQALFERAQQRGVWWAEDRQLQLPSYVDKLIDLRRWIANCDLLYLTVCLDVLPAAVAPGVSAPAAAGVPLAVVEAIVDVALASGKLALIDFAEFNPNFDIDMRTAKVLARLIDQIVRAGDVNAVGASP